jgi:hypothetical protein
MAIASAFKDTYKKDVKRAFLELIRSNLSPSGGSLEMRFSRTFPP